MSLVVYIKLLIYKAKELSREENKEIHKIVDKMFTKSNINKKDNPKLRLYIFNKHSIEGYAIAKDIVLISSKIIDLFKEHPCVFKQMVGHEMGHIERKELRSKGLLVTKKRRAISILRELRADLRAIDIAELTNDDVKEAFKINKEINEVNKEVDKENEKKILI